MSVDWGEGDYARTAAVLEPAAHVALDHAGVRAGQRVLDVACGTGSGVLGAAARGAYAIGVDRAPTLIDLARQRAQTAGLDGEFLVGDALNLPVSDAAFDVVLSVFGVIFASDPSAAAAELLRAARPGGLVLVTKWTDEGPIAATARILRRARGGPEPTTPAPRWDDLLAAAGAGEVSVTAASLPFTAESPAAWLADQEEHHPVWRAARRQLTEQVWEDVRAETLEVLANANEDPDAFLTTGRYLLVRGARPPV